MREENPREHVVVVGGGPVGHRFVEELRERDGGKRFAITLVGEESRLPYDRVHLSAYFDGKREEDLAMGTRAHYSELDVTLHLGDPVTTIRRQERVVLTAGGFRIGYDWLVLATGSRAFVPPLKNVDATGVFVYRTLDDLFAIEAYAKQSKRGAVLGGGLLGLEAAKALSQLGLETTVVELAPRLMPMQLDGEGAAALRTRIEALGLRVMVDTAVAGIVCSERGRVDALALADGSSLESDLVVVSAGIRPRDELARAAEIEVGPRGGIAIDDLCRTSDARVFAVGECALHGGRIYGLVGPGFSMAKVAADVLHRGEASEERFTGADLSTKLKLLGVDVASFGDAFGTTAGARSVALRDGVADLYKRLVVSADGKTLLGGQLVGDASDYDFLSAICREGSPMPASADQLLMPPGDGAAPVKRELPASATICSCNNVTKGAVCDAIRGGSRDLAALKQCTKVATGCGGCAQLTTQVLKAELLAMGEEVSNALCEHFTFSRQELYHILRIEGIRTFDELIKRHGTGRGCEICKPAVASMLASEFADHVLAPQHAPLQDSNDYFLANIQKDGTYSIVPRVAGGEITPDGLIAMGRIAKRYGLYTKITGGQRIDMFGARVEQLPAIWKELIEAGFESGQAYGKSMRTVKSCVGSTWCRYGVQDSVAMALRIENRYRGLRSPHKLKSAVSGCTRECAEAQSKDFGVIATEKGWNLYVCGNGGMKPRHADLLASDLDDEMLIRLIDRFLVFYIRTADRLQRTASWLDQLEGGLDYLRKVVIDDSLGMCAELEAHMQKLVDSYECEWKGVVEDPAKQRRFKHFVNSAASDENVVFVKERGQIRPARSEERRRLVVVS